MNWLEWIIDAALGLMVENLYAGVFAAAVLETIIPVIPSELVFPLAGYAMRDAALPWYQIIPVGITGGAGATTGAIPIYLISRKFGRPGLRRFVLTSERAMDRAEKWFSKYGDKSVLLGRCVPGIRELVSVPAGILNMNIKKFLAYTVAGSCIWSTALTAAGYYLDDAIPVIH